MSNQRLELFRQYIGQRMVNGFSPMGTWLAGKLLDVHEGALTVSFDVRKEMTNPAGILHGGAAAAMLDEIMGVTVYLLNQADFYASVNLSIDYLASAREGDEIIGRTRVIRAGRRIINIEGWLESSSGERLVKATSNLVAAPKFNGTDRA
ncbi:MAG: PaaI family thioesterase [Caldilineaceae bacterium]|nr:PaaI family thioesterase [Caldilineaceae bacterium]